MQAIAALSMVAAASATEVSFSEWASKHGKVYASKSEIALRRSIFAAAQQKIKAHNAEGHSWSMGLNKFADLTAEEFKALYASGYRAQEKRSKNVNLSLLHSNANPASVDWSTKGAVTPIKNQEQCGSCWAFSTTGSVEGISFISTGTLPSVSEQQLVDCSGAEGNQGCNGGLMDYGFEYIIKNKGITGETNYPYTAKDGTCAAAGKPVAATISGYKDVPVNSEVGLETAIVTQPVSVAVEADQSVFQYYTGGVMDSACGTQLDHGVLAVGYGTEGGKEYFKVKNSWGADWGAKGYILLGRGAKFNPAGQCGIQMAASYPTKA